tara:strand:- start:1678 stop:2097 length:420 start_codon:yes stop_codon:yes gene_type:complete
MSPKKLDTNIVSTIWEHMFKLDTYYYEGQFTTTFYVVLLIAFMIIAISFRIIYYNFTRFTRTITVHKTYTRNRTKGDSYFVVDINNTVYQVDNLWFKLDFNRADDWVSLEEGNTYKVDGYGVRMDFMDMYPIINSIKKI